jgi:hypothetical protein
MGGAFTASAKSTDNMSRVNCTDARKGIAELRRSALQFCAIRVSVMDEAAG